MMAFFPSLATPVAAEKSLWQGLHLSYGKTWQTGTNDLTLSHEKVGSFQVWELPLSGHGFVAEVGYRWQLGRSLLMLGPTFSLMKGDMTGSRTWRHDGTGASATLAYASEIQATVGIELGYIASERTLFTLEGGVVATDGSLSLAASYRDFAAGTGISGYMPGTYVSIGVDHRLKNGAVVELEVGHYNFDCADQIGVFDGVLSTKATVVGVSIGWQF
jgi:hypothetical protein